MIFPILAGFLGFIVILTVLLKRGDKEKKANEEEFWQRENEANNTRRQDISTLDYIEIPQERLPFGCTGDTDILDIEAQLDELSEKKILNFEGATNTELKKKYGAPNMEELIACDEAFLNLARLLNEWGVALYNIERVDEAKSVLEYAVEIKSDVSATYVTLAKIYKRMRMKSELAALSAKVAALNTSSRDAILEKLEMYSA